MSFQGGSMVKNPPANAGDTGDVSSIPVSRRSPGGGNGNLFYPVFLPGKFHGQRSLASYNPWGCRLNSTGQTHTHAHFYILTYRI